FVTGIVVLAGPTVRIGDRLLHTGELFLTLLGVLMIGAALFLVTRTRPRPEARVIHASPVSEA
ncbi:MAG TPA: hypothetical protein VF698_18450, partial [Thermoanaerobaculia bacterium]